jgi:hypothetical protein
MRTRNVYISRRNFMKAGAVAAAMASLSVPAMAASAEEENCLWTKITPRRSTQYGPVVGLDQGESLVWYGIPYGAAPVGELRWQAPQDPAVWTEAKDCTAPSEVAYQYGSGAIGTEDCLKLDVYTTPNAHKLPVLVFIHGGNNQTGNTKEILGSELVVRDNCVFVTLDYRLGLFGFNCLPALCRGSDDTGNFTLLDSEDKSTGDDLAKTPDHTGNLGLDWQASELVSANLAWQYVGSQVIKVPARNAQAFTSKHYQTLDVNTKWTVTPALDFKLGITNLTNTQRDEVATDADFILEGRTVYAGVDYKL